MRVRGYMRVHACACARVCARAACVRVCTVCVHARASSFQLGNFTLGGGWGSEEAGLNSVTVTTNGRVAS